MLEVRRVCFDQRNACRRPVENRECDLTNAKLVGGLGDSVLTTAKRVVGLTTYGKAVLSTTKRVLGL